MYFQVEMPGNGRKNIFRNKQTINKVRLIYKQLQCVRI